MARWVCPQCEREFGAVRQAHTCLPGITVAELLSRHPDWVGGIHAAMVAHLRAQGPLHEDAVNVGVFLKSDRTTGPQHRLISSPSCQVPPHL